MTDFPVEDTMPLPSRRVESGPGLELIRGHIAPPPIDFAELASDRRYRAIHRSLDDAASYPRLGMPELDALAGAMAPGELWVVGGRQGNGKSLFIHNLISWLIEQEVPSVVLGTEQSDHELALKQACVMAKVPARMMLKPDPSVWSTTAWAAQQAEVQAALDTLHTDHAHLVAWATDEFIDRGSLLRWTEEGVEQLGARVIIVDHLHHMRHGDGKNDVHELTETVHLAKTLAKRHKITMVCASQIKRTGGDAVRVFTPPSAEDFAGAAAIERTADVMLGLWRPLRDDLPVDELKAMQHKAKMGHAAEDRVYQPNVMGVRLLKDRLGDAPGKQAMLGVDRGQLTRIPERDRYVTDSYTRGPRV